jgi:uncharacterized protein (DUF433 family)
MTTPARKTPLIVETRRGPCIAGTRITVFSVMDYLKDGWSRDAVKQAMGISDEQLDAVLAYITRHKQAVENEYTAIVRRSEARRARYEKLFHERSPFPPHMPLEERVSHLRQRLAKKHNASQ